MFSALAKDGELGLALRLSTGFGGGKTHTLLTLWHLARNIDKHDFGTELLPSAGRPNMVNVAAVDGAKAGHPIFAQHGGVVVKSLAGDLAYQFGGAAGGLRLQLLFEASAPPQRSSWRHRGIVDGSLSSCRAAVPGPTAQETRAHDYGRAQWNDGFGEKVDCR